VARSSNITFSRLKSKSIESTKTQEFTDEELNAFMDDLERNERKIPKVVHVKEIVNLFETSNLISPQIICINPVDNIDYVLNIAGKNTQVPGSINVIESHTGEWMGRILENGIFQPCKRVSPEKVESASRALLFLASDPTEMARRYGKRTGRCCFCRLTLKDKNSVEHGYGPICAKRYGLLW